MANPAIKDKMTTPIPVILVLGDMPQDGSDQPTFGGPAWDEIYDEYKESIGPDLSKMVANLNLNADPSTVRQRLESLRDGQSEDQIDITFPIPIKVHHGERDETRKRDFGTRLLQYLCEFDVWAILACGPAGPTHALLYDRNAPLKRLSRPIFITVDSTALYPGAAGASTQLRPHILRLMPSNFHQAEAIATHIQSALKPSTTIVKIYARGSDPYIADMYQTLYGQLDLTRDVKPVEIDRPSAIQEPDTVVCVGYFKQFEECRDALRRKKCTNLILTDGCFRNRTLDSLDELDQDKLPWEHLFGCRPNRSPEDYAREVFVAVRQAHLDLIDRSHMQLNRRASSIPNSATLRHVVEERLERQHPTWYNFANAVNRKGGYSVDELTTSEQREEWRRHLHRGTQTQAEPAANQIGEQPATSESTERING